VLSLIPDRDGGGLARNLIRAKKSVLVFDLNPEAVKTTLAAGANGRAAAKIEELAEGLRPGRLRTG
jgi:3-hydroxyisobutyrate dehydrogenase-like beta-hydroxyacid dehydrogenase